MTWAPVSLDQDPLWAKAPHQGKARPCRSSRAWLPRVEAGKGGTQGLGERGVREGPSVKDGVGASGAGGRRWEGGMRCLGRAGQGVCHSAAGTSLPGMFSRCGLGLHCSEEGMLLSKGSREKVGPSPTLARTPPTPCPGFRAGFSLSWVPASCISIQRGVGNSGPLREAETQKHEGQAPPPRGAACGEGECSPAKRP